MISSILFHDDPTPDIARDTLYSSLMIIVNGFLGGAVLLGGLRHGVQHYNLQSSRLYLSMLLALWGLAFFVPSYLPATAKAPYKGFLIVLCIVIFALFLWAQGAQHRYGFHKSATASDLQQKFTQRPATAFRSHTGRLPVST